MLPIFRYHPDPIATGNMVASDVTCGCCGEAKGFIYRGSIYGDGILRDTLCPWCIADGSAAEKFGVFFSDGEPLAQAGVPQKVIKEVTERTPGYISWQQEVWLACCRDACEFHGDAPSNELRALTGEALRQVLFEWAWKDEYWTPFVEDYQPGGGAAVYKFVCRHCHNVRYGLDLA